MKKFKITWMLAGLLLLFSAYVYFIEIKGTQKKAVLKEKQEKIFSFEKSKVMTLTLTNEKGVFKLKRMGEKEWLLEKPINAPADKMVCDSLLDVVSTLKPSRVITEEGGDLTPYGLKTPHIQVEIELKDKGEKLVLKVGDENPVGDSLFITDQKSKKVMLALRSLEYTLNKDLKQLREKRLFTFNADESSEIEIKDRSLEETKSRLVLKKEGEKWYIASMKEKLEAEAKKIQEILNALNFLEVHQFEDEAKDLGKFGLLQPSLTVVVRSNQTTQLELLFGKKEKDFVYVAKRAEKPIYQVRSAVLHRISSDPSKLFKEKEKKGTAKKSDLKSE